VLTYLMTKGNRGKWKNSVPNYLKNLITAIEKAEAEYDAEKKRIDEQFKSETPATSAGESEEESLESDEGDDKRWEARREAMKKKRETILATAFEATFGHIKDSDWKKLDRAWRDYAG
jgi:hypothetical protein